MKGCHGRIKPKKLEIEVLSWRNGYATSATLVWRIGKWKNVRARQKKILSSGCKSSRHCVGSSPQTPRALFQLRKNMTSIHEVFSHKKRLSEAL